ncbi:MAG: AsmA-like C-terminal region-containing protein [Saprospiraceae bacterium]
MRKWLKISAIFLTLIILIILLIPVIYKGRIAQFIKQKINSQLHGTLAFKDASLSLIRDFPCVSLNLDSLVITGKDQFKDVNLLSAKNIRLGFDLKKLVFSNFKELRLIKVALEQPELNLVTTSSGVLNLTDLNNKTESESDSSSDQNLQVRLDHVQISGGHFKFIDSSEHVYINLVHLDLQSKGSYQDNKLILNQTSAFDSLIYINESMTLLNNLKCTWKGLVGYDLDSSKLSLEHNKMSLNSLAVDINGFIQLISDGSTSMLLEINAPENDLKQLISLVPGAYQAHFNELSASGTFKFNSKVSGIFDSKTGEQPKISLNSSIEHGNIKYKHLPYPIQEIQLMLDVQTLDKFGKYFKIDIPGFSFDIEHEPVSGRLSVVQSKEGSAIKGETKGVITLSTLNKTIPWDSLKMSGRVSFNTQFDFTEAQITRKEYDKIKFAGSLSADQVKINSPLFMPFKVAHVTTVFDPRSTTIKLDSAYYGKSDLTGQIQINNPLALSTGNYRKAEFTIESISKLLDINELMNYNSTSSSTENKQVSFSSESIPTQLNLAFSSTSKQINYKDYQISAAKMAGKFHFDTLSIKQLDLVLNKSPMSISGMLVHPYAWSNENAVLKGDLKVTSSLFILDEWMKESPPGGEQTKLDTFFIKNLPDKTDLSLKIQLGQLAYGSLLFKELSGDARLNNQVLEVYNSNGNLYNGNFSLNGVYQESEATPNYNFKIDLNKLKIEDMFKSSKTFAALVPIAAFIEGSFSTSVITSGKLNAAMSPVWNSLDASGIFETFQGIFTKFKPLEEIANKIQIPLINKINWEKSRNYFEIDKGSVTVKPFVIKSGDISIQASGRHQLNQEMNYNFLFSIPRKLFDKYKIGLAVNDKLEWIRSQASKNGILLSSLDTIYIMANILGNITNPVTKISWVQNPNAISITDQLKENISKEIKDQIDSAKASATDKINQKKDSLIKILKDDVSLKKEQIDSLSHKVEDSLKSLAEKKSKEIIDSVIRKQSGKILDSSLQTKLDTLVGGKAKEEIKKINDKLKDWNPFKKKPKSN